MVLVTEKRKMRLLIQIASTCLSIYNSIPKVVIRDIKSSQVVAHVARPLAVRQLNESETPPIQPSQIVAHMARPSVVYKKLF